MRKIRTLGLLLFACFNIYVAAQEKVAKATGNIHVWNKYPTYSEYVTLMDSFARTFPHLCSKTDIGQSVQGKRLLCIRINPDVGVPKPAVMYSASMHGDETGGYILMLHLIDYLLSNYNHSALVTKLTDGLDIWINPLANPDGMYVDPANVWSSKRENANGADLNRNFPDFNWDAHPDQRAYQPETKAMMALMDEQHFVLSANFHAGAEVVNYPWDGDYRMHPDSAWFRDVSQQYADSAQFYGRSGYFTDVSDNGITDGYAWYPVFGGRQDYITGTKQGRELTIELDETKTTPESQLLSLWNYNYRSLLHYIEQAMYGIQGLVTDSATGQPLKAKIELVGHDDGHSFVYSDSLSGAFYRPVSSGTFDVKVSASGYDSLLFNSVKTTSGEKVTLYAKLHYNGTINTNTAVGQPVTMFPNPCANYVYIANKQHVATSFVVEIYTLQGIKVLSAVVPASQKIDVSALIQGIYIVNMRFKNTLTKQKIRKL